MKSKYVVVILIMQFLFITIFAAFFLFANKNGTIDNTHLPLYNEITAIKDRLTINITELGFTNPVTVCEFYELREVYSEELNQTTVNYWVFQHGKETEGDIEAFVEIYNAPYRTDLFIVEVARNCWNELTISLDGNVVEVFPTVSENVLSLGYLTFEVEP